MTFKLKIIFSLTFLLFLNTIFGQKRETDTTFISHLTYFDQESVTQGEGPNNHFLVWNTKKYIPKSFFVVEKFYLGKWVKQLQVNENSPLRKREYFSKKESNCIYKFKIPPHSGENIIRVRLMNDSNVCLALSRELKWISVATPKVSYTDKKGSKEIRFSNETNYEIFDSKGILVKNGRGMSVSYADLDVGNYTLNYDNSSTTFTKKE